MANELTVGTRRVGEFIDFYPDTPKVTVTLERSEEGISVTLPWSDPDSPHAQWFLADRGTVRIPPGPEPLPVPRRVLFHDSHGSLLLIRCWPRGFHANALGPGTGTLWARAAVMGVSSDVEFDRPHGIQTEITGLRAWLGVTSWAETHDLRTDTPAVVLTTQGTPAIEVGEFNGLGLSFVPGWQVLRQEARDRRVLLDTLHAATRSVEPHGWSQHLQVHQAVRDLLVLSRWHAESCAEAFALRDDDPRRSVGGTEHGSQWRPVVAAAGERASQPEGYRPHLIRYQELQPEGILRWLALRDAFARALDPVISSIELRGTIPNTLLAHTGPGLEALGYLLMLRDGLDERAAARATLQARFERILKDIGDVLPFDAAVWARRTVAVYNGLKHANRAEPDALDVLNAWRESVMVVRAWVAAELGIALGEVKDRLASDPQRYEYVKID